MYGMFTQTLPRLLGGGDATIGQKVRLALSGHAGHVRLPLDQQPSIVADTGCGDGTLLLRLYRYVRERTRRGKQLETRPLLMVGVDFNEESLVATAKTLREAGVPFETMFGDIGDPEPIHEGLCSRFGARGKDDILHVRSFLDHDRPYVAPTDGAISAGAIEEESDAANAENELFGLDGA